MEKQPIDTISFVRRGEEIIIQTALDGKVSEIKVPHEWLQAVFFNIKSGATWAYQWPEQEKQQRYEHR